MLEIHSDDCIFRCYVFSGESIGKSSAFNSLESLSFSIKIAPTYLCISTSTSSSNNGQVERSDLLAFAHMESHSEN